MTFNNNSIPGFKNFTYKGYDISFILDYFGEINPYIKVILKNKKYNKAIALKYPIDTKINLDSYSDIASNIYGIIDFIEILSSLKSQEEIKKVVSLTKNNPAFEVTLTPDNNNEQNNNISKDDNKQKIKKDESELTSWFSSIDTSRYLRELDKEKEENK